ncbi:MAG: hypothetical protein ACOWW1_04675 [archaeon]
MSSVKHITCSMCSCLCDNIEITIEKDKIKRIKNGCSMCTKFIKYNKKHRLIEPMSWENGKRVPVSLTKAVYKAAKILVNAKYPIFYGWASTTSETIDVGVKIAEEVGGVYDNCAINCPDSSSLGIQQAGISQADLGQIRHRAELVICWGYNPIVTHPKLFGKTIIGQKGKYTKGNIIKCYNKNTLYGNQQKDPKDIFGDETAIQRYPANVPNEIKKLTDSQLDRKLIVVDVEQTATAEIGDYFIKIEPNSDFELFQALRVLIKGGELDVNSVAGIPVEKIEKIADILINSRFGVIFWSTNNGTVQNRGNTEAAIQLVRDLNNRTKFVMMPVHGCFNTVASNLVTSWLTGYPHSVDFSMGYPRYNPGETSINNILQRRENDASLIIDAPPRSAYPKKLIDHVTKNPLIILESHENALTLMADIAIPVAVSGIEASGTAYRMDNVPVTLKKAIDPPGGILTDKEILNMIFAKVKELKSENKRITNHLFCA